ncbi:MAG: phosphoglycerate kinase [Candidatus Burarchaeum sp.]|nr:phosphoglycerate kinase [Candidatus Burarchaeum sp.]MDO8339353.1 phosphoglycerate kinase [Candidatus Burarchaeum sp.]
MKFKTMDDFEFDGKVALVRVDLNSEVDEKTKKVTPGGRMDAHAQTVVELARKNAKTVLLAHQGRKGEYDFLPLEQHAEILSEKIAMHVKFVPDVAGAKAQEAIKEMRPGDVILLDNVRFLADETKGNPADAEIVKALAPLADVFILDAFSMAHRAQASVVGFAGKLPVLAGRVMERELKALTKFENPKKPVVFVLGGAKPEDSLPVLERWLKEGRLDKALTCGVLGNLFLMASGRKLGAETEKFLEKKDVLKDAPKAKELLAKYGGRIMYPSDVAVDENGKRVELAVAKLPAKGQVKDIGLETSKAYVKEIGGAGTVMMNGPAGVYESEAFADGTKYILRAIEHAHGFSLLGGGHTLAALARFEIDTSGMGYVSLSGKALIEFLSGEELPGVKMLEEYAGKK